MNSLTLKENGFAAFMPLKELSFSSLPINKGSVLVLADCTLTGKPASDIIYIGKTNKLTKRIFGGYLAGYGGKTTRKINSKLFDDGYLEKTAISWMTADNPKLSQKELLDKFKTEHGEFPAWNISNKSPQKTKPAAPKVAIARPARKAPKSSSV
jgi:hypothetical protein